MSEIGVRPNQSAIRSRAGVMTAAALFYLSGAMETEAEPAAGDQNTTEQAPTPRAGAKPVHAAGALRRRPCADRAEVRHTAHGLGPGQPAARADRGAGGTALASGRGASAAGPAGGDEPGRIGRDQPAARTDPLSGHQYRHHAAAGADPQHAADRQRHPAGDHPGAERHHHRAGPAVHSGHYVQLRRRRPARRRSDHPRLRRARRPVP